MLSAFAAMVRHACPDDGDVRLADEAHDYLSGCMQAAKREWEATLAALDAAEAERDEERAALAALRESALALLAALPYLDPDGEADARRDLLLADIDGGTALADQYRARVRAEALREAADACDAACAETRHESMWGPVVTERGAGMGAMGHRLRALAAETERGK